MPWAIGVLGPGFDADPARHGLAVALARIMVPYVLLACAAAVLGAMLNGLGRFASLEAMSLVLRRLLHRRAGAARPDALDPGARGTWPPASGWRLC